MFACGKLHKTASGIPSSHAGTLWTQTTLTPHADTTGRGKGNIVLRVTHQTREGTDGGA